MVSYLYLGSLQGMFLGIIGEEKELLERMILKAYACYAHPYLRYIAIHNMAVTDTMLHVYTVAVCIHVQCTCKGAGLL